MAKLIVGVFANAAALLAAGYVVRGFNLKVNLETMVLLAVILTALNMLLKPVLKLILGPIIVLTFGLGLIVVNMIVLYVLDMLSEGLTIESVSALIYSSIIVGLVNTVFHMATKK